MMNVYFGGMLEAVSNTATYFKNTYWSDWITKPLSVEMISSCRKNGQQ